MKSEKGGGGYNMTNKEQDFLTLRNVPGVYSFCKHDVAAKQVLNDDGKYYAECLICGFYTEVL
mgnify:CR=1 FL=1